MLKMYKQMLGSAREVCVYGKEDGDASLVTHESHTKFISCCQVHGNEIFVVGEKHTTSGKEQKEADALFSCDGKPLGVFVADCLPLVLVGGDACAVVHCSWKSLHSGLVQKTLEKFDIQDIVSICAYLGPCIKHYEVGKEFEQYFPKEFLRPSGEKYLFDLVGYVVSILSIWGVTEENIIVDSGCTWRDTQEYWSYRRGDRQKRNFVGVRMSDLTKLTRNFEPYNMF